MPSIVFFFYSFEIWRIACSHLLTFTVRIKLIPSVLAGIQMVSTLEECFVSFWILTAVFIVYVS